MDLDLRRTASLFIDFQADVCAAGGRMVSDDPAVLARFQLSRDRAGAVLADLRARNGSHRVFVRHVFQEGYPELAGVRRVGMESYVSSKGAFADGTPGADWVPELKPHADETVFAKTTISAFATTPLDRWLRRRGVDTVAICGVVSHYAVLAATIAAYDLGYRAIVLKDCCASADPQRHDTAMSILQPLAEVVDSDAFLAAL